MESLRLEVRYCACGCGQELPTPVCRTRIPRFINGHNSFRLGTPYAIDPSTECWNWLREKNEKGYGRLVRDRRRWLAHMWYYVQKYGPVPEGLQLDHTCRNRGCCNPDHVEPVTQSINQRRGLNSKLTLEQVDELKMLKGTCSTRDAAKNFDISHQTVRKYWLQ